MTNHAFLFISGALLLVAAIVTAGCTFPSAAPPPPTTVPTPVPTTVPPETPAPSACGFTTCHGLDLACGTNAPQVCTMEYQIGDQCRKYASCDTSGGGCTFVPGPKYVACKNCVEQCMFAAGPDNLAALSCAEKC